MHNSIAFHTKSIQSKIKSILLIAFEDQKIIDEVKSAYPLAEIETITKNDLTGKSFREILKLINKKHYDLLVISNRYSQLNRSDSSLKLLALFSHSSAQLLIFDENRIRRYSKLSLFFDLTPKLVAGLLFGFYTLVKAYLYFTVKEKIWKNKILENKSDCNKIAYLRTDLSGKVISGGAITHITGFIEGAKSLGYEVIFLSDAKILADFETNIIHPNPLLDLFDELQLLDYHFTFIRKSKKILETYKPCLIYQRHSVFNASGIALSMLFNIPIILEVNYSEVWVKKNWSRLVFEKLASKIERIAFENANIISVVSEVVKDQIVPLGANESKIVINPNGVDVNKFSPTIDGSQIKNKYNLENKFTVGFIGTFTRWHGVEIFFEAAVEILKQNRDIKFLLIGDGNLKAVLEWRCGELNLKDKIVFTGIIPHSEAPNYLAACDILVSPHLGFESNQRFFGSPTKLFEYMAMGKPIIASDLEQIGKIIQHKVNGIKVKPGDAAELTLAILDLIENEELRRSIGANARKDAENNFTWKMNAERVLAKVISS